jgi:hypothetical protein
LGDVFEFRVHLLGSGIEHLGVVTDAVALLGQQGLGAGRGTAVLSSIWEQSPLGAERLPLSAHAKLGLTVGCEEVRTIARTLPSQSIAVNFVTPTHIERDGAPVQRPGFGNLVRALFGRIALLHGPDVWSPQNAELVHRAANVRLLSWCGEWQSWNRYSSRQDRHLLQDGLVGTARYEGDLEPYLPYLVFGQAIHIGKACTFGQGQYSLEAD